MAYKGCPGGLAPWFRPWRTKGGPGGLPPCLCHGIQRGSVGLAPPGLGHSVQGGVRGLAPRFRPQCLELTHFVTGSVMFFVVFHAFRNLYTPPKTPFFTTGPASLLVVIRGFPHILLMLEHKIGCFVVISMVFHCKSRCGCILYIYH